MKLVLINHFYNEADCLLSYWLRHHLRMFDHGILINYNSTDDSVAMIKEMAPDWEIIPARTPYFGAVETDQHVQSIEKDVEKRFGKGTWKIALNTTEFLIHPDIKGLLSETSSEGVKAFGVAMVDHPAQRHDPLVMPDLFSQKFFGRFDIHHGRLLHRRSQGGYTTGRHTWANEGQTPLINELLLLWFGWCPIDQVKQRKLQIQHRIPEHDRRVGFGFHHHMDETLLEKRYLEEEVPKSYWLHKQDFYLQVMNQFHERYGLTMQLPEVETE